MYAIKEAEHVLNSHATLAGLESFLEGSDIGKEYLEFIRKSIRFAYPKTIWMQLSVDDGTTELKTRLTLPLALAERLRGWFGTSSFDRIVFDLRNVTIFDLRGLLHFLNTAADQLRSRYYVCDPLLLPLLIQNGVETRLVYHSEERLLRDLRRAPDLKRCDVLLPTTVLADDLDKALLTHAPSERVSRSDIVILDMRDVHQIDFAAASMLTAYTYTFAHRYGLLTSLTNIRRKVLRDLEDLGVLRPIFSYLIGAPDPAPAGLGERFDIVPMHSFNYQQLIEINNLFLTGTLRALEIDPKWLNPVSKRRAIPNWEALERTSYLVRLFLDVVNELDENVAKHSKSHGYLMIQLNLQGGLSLYVGDSGVGLAASLSSTYDLDIDSALYAVQLAFELGQHREKRRGAGLRFGGRGLEKVRQIFGELNGRIRLQTGDALALYRPAEKRAPLAFSDKHYFVQGTHYNLFIPTPTRR